MKAVSSAPSRSKRKGHRGHPAKVASEREKAKRRRKRVATLVDLIHDIAQEAHTMGRLYTAGGEKRNPALQFEHVRVMVATSLSAGRVVWWRPSAEAKP